ncbi:MAG: asparaginase [Ilumatobacteraceae bacterium]
MAVPEAFAPVAITTRSGFDESVHFGAVVCLGASGQVEHTIGDPSVEIYPRSSMKPLQATAMVRNGLRLPPRLLALVCASHDGTPTHVAAAGQILATAGLTEDDLANTPGLPLDAASAQQILCGGGGPARVTMNCSGKHSGMLATCVINGWDADATYLHPDHPLQAAITATVDELAEETHLHIGIDGCGAPAHVISLIGLARAFRAIAIEGAAVAEAMTGYPVMVGGRERDVTRLMDQVPGLLAKDGAEGVFAAALPDGRAVAVKIADGAGRARIPVMLAALSRIGINVDELRALLAAPVLGHGQPVGEVRALSA